MRTKHAYSHTEPLVQVIEDGDRKTEVIIGVQDKNGWGHTMSSREWKKSQHITLRSK